MMMMIVLRIRKGQIAGEGKQAGRQADSHWCTLVFNQLDNGGVGQLLYMKLVIVCFLIV